MTWQRAAATWLLVLCLAVGAFSPIASPSLTAGSDIPQPPLGVSATDATVVCVFGNKSENSSNSEAQPAVASLANGLLLLPGGGGLFLGSGDGATPNQIAAAADIRGPPQTTDS